MQSTDTYNVLRRHRCFFLLLIFSLFFEACAPAIFHAAVGIEVRTRSLSLDSSGSYRATDDSLFVPEQLHAISSLCLMVNVTGDGIAPALPGEGSSTCSDPKTQASFPGIGKISSFIDGANLSASSASVSVPIGTRTIDLIGFEKSSFPNSQCPSGSIEIRGPNGDAAEMFANGVKVNFNLAGGGPYLFARKAVSILPGDNNIVLEVQKASYGPWAGKDYGCGGGEDRYPQIEYAKAYYPFSTATGTSTGTSTVNPTGPIKQYDVLRPTLQNFELGKDHCELNIQTNGVSSEDPAVAGFLTLDQNTCSITVTGAWPTYEQSGTPIDLEYIQVGVNVRKDNGNSGYTEFFILGPNKTPGILNVAKVFSAGADGSSPVEFKSSKRGDFYSGISAQNFSTNQRYLYVVLENQGLGVAHFGLNGMSVAGESGDLPAFGSLVFESVDQPTSLSLLFGAAITPQSVPPCFTYGSILEGELVAKVANTASYKCFLRYKIFPVNGSAWLELNNYDLSSNSVVWPNLYGVVGESGAQTSSSSTVALRSWINLRVFEGVSLDPSAVACDGKMLRNFTVGGNEESAEITSTDVGVLGLETECTYDAKNSELIAKVSGLQLPEDPGANASSFTKTQLKMNFTSASGVEAYHFSSDGSYQSGGYDEYWWDATVDPYSSLNLLKFLRVEQHPDSFDPSQSYTYQSPIDSEQYGSVYVSALVNDEYLYKRIRLRVKSQGP